MKMTPKALLFDMDGTLTDPRQKITEASSTNEKTTSKEEDKARD